MYRRCRFKLRWSSSRVINNSKFLKQALIIFVRNPVLGEVKTRIAKTAGEEKALEIYIHLLEHTREITSGLACDKFVFYADRFHETDTWNSKTYSKDVQRGENLGLRMNHAFTTLFTKGYQHICIVGSDCAELTGGIIEEAFSFLQAYDVVIGPSSDGGYYLLGLSNMHPALFEGISWSTPRVLEQTLQQCARKQLDYHLLATLNDIDNEEDWTFYQNSLK